MSISDKTTGVSILTGALPYASSLVFSNMEADRAIYFEWRKRKFKIEMDTCDVWSVNGSELSGSEHALLIETIVRLTLNNAAI